MDNLLPVIGLLIVAAITPGPNNMIVMEAGMRGPRAAARVVAGTVAGSLLLLVLTSFGLGALFATFPAALTALALAGSAYLFWLGARMAWLAGAGVRDETRTPTPSTPVAMALFQLANPKAWLLVGTGVALLPGAANLVTLAVAIVVITSVCLVSWAIAGAATLRLLRHPAARKNFDRSTGVILAASALMGVLHVAG